MLYKKQGLPEEDELVICTITKIQYNSVFARLDEYGKTGMIHISEISPGRIRNIRDYVKEGKVVVCKVLRIHREREHIDLSLRRVNDMQKRNKIDQIKLEQKCEKIVELTAKELKVDFKELYYNITEKVFTKYPNLQSFFEEVSKGNANLGEFIKDKKEFDILKELITTRMKPAEVEIRGRLNLQSYTPEGINDLKIVLKKNLETNKKIRISYEGGGKYKISVNAEEYKEAEKVMKKVTENIISDIKKKKGIASFIRED